MKGLYPVQYLWLIPALPFLAAAVIALCKQSQRRLAASLAVGALVAAGVLAGVALAASLELIGPGGMGRATFNFPWFTFGTARVSLGWVLDPLAASMLLMVTVVGALIFVYSLGYMAADPNLTRFFGFMSLFAGAMLGLVIANSLLLLFICWELVGLASYLLIGFWHQKPSAAAAAKKAFLTTRVGDLCFLIGMVWLYARTGTLLFYDQGSGCLEAGALTRLVTAATVGGMAVSTGISWLIFVGAMGKSGQVPLHVWLPDAMEGPTPVSALIHAATMVAAGVFLVARMYPLLAAMPGGEAGISTALKGVAWVGSVTAVFAASIAVAQTDIKRILAYSTVSQLGYMMLAMGVGGYVAGMFHLIAHAFCKSLLFLGAGSVIHGCHAEQDIRRMGGLRHYMPATFLTYAIGMLSLTGVPVLFSGFWSKEEILHGAWIWPVSHGPFYLGLGGAFLTAFYMTRQVCYVFCGRYRGGDSTDAQVTARAVAARHHGAAEQVPHESPGVMTVPLLILAAGAVLLSAVGTAVWPWLPGFLAGRRVEAVWNRLWAPEFLILMAVSTGMVAAGFGLAWWLYGRRSAATQAPKDALEEIQPEIFKWLRDRLYMDEFYAATFIRWNNRAAQICQWLDHYLWGGCIVLVTYLTMGLGWANRLLDEYAINLGFDAGCGGLRGSGRWLARLQNGRIQNYLAAIGVALVALVLWLVWGRGL